jgi:hypothetical protein
VCCNLALAAPMPFAPVPPDQLRASPEKLQKQMAALKWLDRVTWNYGASASRVPTYFLRVHPFIRLMLSAAVNNNDIVPRIPGAHRFVTGFLEVSRPASLHCVSNFVALKEGLMRMRRSLLFSQNSLSRHIPWLNHTFQDVVRSEHYQVGGRI